MDLPQLRPDGERSREQGQLPLGSFARQQERADGERGKQQEGRRGIRLAVHDRIAQPGADAAALPPEPEWTGSVGVRILLMPLGLVKDRTDQPTTLNRLRSQ